MRIWNTKETALHQALDGMMLANPGKYQRLLAENGYGLYLASLPKKRVRVVINGGGGYGPMWAGFAEEGLADAMVQGEFDSAPNAYVLYEMAKAVECGCGVLFLTNHFMGDYLNNDMAVELLARDKIAAKACYITDDVLSCKGEARKNRGGLHGIGQVCKIAAAAARRGDSLEAVSRLAEKANTRLRTVSLNIRGDRMFFGEGFSGEPAAFSMEYHSADQIAEEACKILLDDLEEGEDDAYNISVNPHCSVGYTESFVLLHSVTEQMKQKGKKIHGCAVGTYFDVFGGTGCMISLLACDRELRECLCPVSGYGFRV